MKTEPEEPTVAAIFLLMLFQLRDRQFTIYADNELLKDNVPHQEIPDKERKIVRPASCGMSLQSKNK